VAFRDFSFCEYNPLVSAVVAPPAPDSSDHLRPSSLEEWLVATT
jgi:hypothetical protein